MGVVLGMQSAMIYLIGILSDEIYSELPRLLGMEPRERKEKGLFLHAWGMVQKLLGNWLIVGDLVATAGDAILQPKTKKPTMYIEMRDNPLVQGINDMYEAVTNFSKAIDNAIEGKSRWPKDLAKGIEKGLLSAGIFTGIPFQGINTAAREFYYRWLRTKSKRRKQRKKITLT